MAAPQEGRPRSQFSDDQTDLADMFENFMAVGPSGKKVAVYMDLMQRIVNREEETVLVKLDDVAAYTRSNPAYDGDALARRIERNAYQYLSILSRVVDGAVAKLAPTAPLPAQDVFDVLASQRERSAEQRAQEAGVEGAAPAARCPAELTRRFEVRLQARSSSRTLGLRSVGSRHVGRLVSFRGVVTQVSDVRPLLTLATYLDDATGVEVYQEVSGRSFTPLAEAPAAVLALHGGRSEMHLQTRGSRFVRFQECRVQEAAEEVPQGATPRTLQVQLRGALTRALKSGEAVRVTGIFLPEPAGAARGRGRGGRPGPASALLTTTYVLGQHVERDKRSYAELAAAPRARAAAERVARGGDTYARLAASVAPEIWGHEDVKRVLLLALVGAPGKQLADGMKIRGDVHVCMMGDPGVAKSQLLRWVCHLAPRAVYTTGKGSSGVGLTAAVVKDPVTGEMVLEGGALVLADKGLCCIDEFDKMDETDRTALHEVMEQQSVSIAKAGIATTLNTRAAVLAAANPAYGRYDLRRSPAENINLPAALLSRFDVLWLMLDRPDAERDLALARHVLAVHRDGKAPGRGGGEGGESGEDSGEDSEDSESDSDQDPDDGASPSARRSRSKTLSMDTLRAYIAAAKQFAPSVPPHLSDYLTAVYAELRAEEAASDQPHSYTTARTLLSILRLSQALARLRFSERVDQSDLDEALRLLRQSKASLREEGGAAARADPVSQIFARIRAHAERTQQSSFTWADLLQLLGTAFKPELIRQCLVDYASINVWQLEGSDTAAPSIHLVAV